MTPQTGSPLRPASRAAIASGVVGLVACGCLLAGVELRAWRLASRPLVLSLFRVHDAASILQSVLLIPVAFALHSISAHRRAPVIIAVASLVTISVLQSLRVINIGPDTLYMLPQGLLGLWLIAVNRRLSFVVPRHITRIGVIAGVGLVLIALSLIAVLAVFGLGLDARSVITPQARTVNRLAHINLRWSSYVGRALYPIWAILLGRWLVRHPHPVRATKAA